MCNKFDNLEVVHEGWLTKSPPSKRIWRARWRKRWFVLKQSGDLPGQYFLYYYTNRNCRTLKGRIDLDQCDQVDAGLEFESSKHRYKFMFDIRTPKRTYYLAAESETDMNKWVECICHVCGLKSYAQEENLPSYESEDNGEVGQASLNGETSPPVSPSSSASGPYIPISECITGKPLGEDSYDSPRMLQLQNADIRRISESNTPPLRSPATDAESVFTPDESSGSRPPVNWVTFPNSSESPSDDSRSFIYENRELKKIEAPPRPPKPQHIINNSQETPTYLNLHEKNTQDNDTYDFPRSHQMNSENKEVESKTKHCYTNAAPSQKSENIFRYDFTEIYSSDEPNSSHSNASSPYYSDNSPVVHRDLKPGRKNSTSHPKENLIQQIDLNHLRHLKPHPLTRHEDDIKPLKLCAPPLRRTEFIAQPSSSTGKNSRTYSETSDVDELSSLDNSRFSIISQHSRNGPKTEIQYLDLDLESEGNGNTSANENKSVVYKEVDFLKTEAFNRTRQKVEEERKQCPGAPN